MSRPYASQPMLPRRMLFTITGVGAVTALAGLAWSVGGQTLSSGTPPASPAAATPGASPEAGRLAPSQKAGTPIRVVIGETILTGRMWDNATARDLIALLPLTLTFRDFNDVEKIADLPRALSTAGMPPGDDPVPADIGYYAPSNHLVFYYGDVGYFNGIMRIGQVDGSVDLIEGQTSDFTAVIERAQ